MNQMPNIQEITKHLLGVLDARSRDIIQRRYGLDQEPETLERIGQQYGITRERVRQIEAQAKKALVKLEPTLLPVRELLETTLAAAAGTGTEEYIVRQMSQALPSAPNLRIIRFYLDIMPQFSFVAGNEKLRPHWELKDQVRPQTSDIINAAQEVLRTAEKPMPAAELIAAVKAKSAANAALPAEFYGASLSNAAAIALTAFGDWGLTAWAEVSPRGVGDKAYAVLRRHGQPEHFRAITELINQARFDHKQANPQTVHNELIKDQRFVLVGRGLYGLKEWGYVPGTVADVLESVLRRSTAPLSREQLIEQVLQQRLVKKNTILLGLQNNKRFVKTAENTYTLRL